MDRKLYVPDVNKWLKYFDKRGKNVIHSNKQVGSGVGNYKNKWFSYMIPIVPRHVNGDDDKTKTKIEVTAPTQGVVERAEAVQEREMAIKRKSGEQIVTTKKVRRMTEQKKRAPASRYKTPINEKDIFG
jgi:hypothetical protein